MQKAAAEQEDQLKNLLANKNKSRQKTQLSLKRKISECTEAPNSPLRKTKAVRKEKSWFFWCSQSSTITHQPKHLKLDLPREEKNFSKSYHFSFQESPSIFVPVLFLPNTFTKIWSVRNASRRLKIRKKDGDDENEERYIKRRRKVKIVILWGHGYARVFAWKIDRVH